jgi:hypothetical protein
LTLTNRRYQPRLATVHQRCRPARRVLGKNGKVVVIPEQLGELVRLQA